MSINGTRLVILIVIRILVIRILVILVILILVIRILIRLVILIYLTFRGPFLEGTSGRRVRRAVTMPLSQPIIISFSCCLWYSFYKRSFYKGRKSKFNQSEIKNFATDPSVAVHIVSQSQ